MTKLPMALYAVLALAAVFLLPATASGSHTTRNFIENAWTTHVLDQSHPAQAAWAYNTPVSYGTGAIQDGFATTAITRFTSYATFSAQVTSVTTRWVDYDNEDWSATPAAEQQDPGRYMQAFTALAHAHGLKVLLTPARDLAGSDKACPNRYGSDNAWYLHCHIAALAASADILDVQDQANMGSPPVYGSFYAAAAAQAHAVNPAIVVDTQVSDAHGSPALAASDLLSTHAPGVFVHVANADVSWEATFIDRMQAAW